MNLVVRSGECWRRTEVWGCPEHPDGPPVLPADGCEREELTLDLALPAALDGFRNLWTHYGHRLGSQARVALVSVGACCLADGLEWRPGPYEPVRYCSRGSLFTKLLNDHMAAHADALREQLNRPTILLDELAGFQPTARQRLLILGDPAVIDRLMREQRDQLDR